MEKFYKYKNRRIKYILHRKNVKNINIRISNGRLNVSANTKVSIRDIEDIFKNNWDKILKMLSFKENIYLKADTLKYIDGEVLLYLGKSYKLKIIKSSYERIVLDKEIKVYLKNTTNRKIKLALDKWYENESRYIFEDSLKRNYTLIKKYVSIYPKLKCRKMTASWGNCRMPSGLITLNKNLIKAPIECIDYVMMHELVHLVHQNHGKEFYSLLNIVMSDWKDRKLVLENKL